MAQAGEVEDVDGAAGPFTRAGHGRQRLAHQLRVRQLMEREVAGDDVDAVGEVGVEAGDVAPT